MSLFPSSLIIAAKAQTALKNTQAILKKYHHPLHNNPDLFVIPDYTIESVREIKKFLSKKSFSHPEKFVLIPEADKLLLEAQNALLKNLEEPGANNYFLLTTTRAQLLLPTVLSRCQIIRIGQETDKIDEKLWSRTGNPKKDLLLASALSADKNQIHSLLFAQLQAQHHHTLKNPSASELQKLRQLITAIKYIDANVDPKSALDWYFLS